MGDGRVDSQPYVSASAIYITCVVKVIDRLAETQQNNNNKQIK